MSTKSVGCGCRFQSQKRRYYAAKYTLCSCNYNMLSYVDSVSDWCPPTRLLPTVARKVEDFKHSNTMRYIGVQIQKFKITSCKERT